MWSSDVVPWVSIATGQQYNRLRADAKGASSFLVHQTEPASTSVIVEGGTFQAGTQNIQVPLATTVAITPTVANNRRTLLYMSSSGIVYAVDGVEGAVPVKPNTSVSNIMLAYIYMLHADNTIEDSDNGNSYIQDARPIVTTKSGAGDAYATAILFWY